MVIIIINCTVHVLVVSQELVKEMVASDLELFRKNPTA